MKRQLSLVDYFSKKSKTTDTESVEKTTEHETKNIDNTERKMGCDYLS